MPENNFVIRDNKFEGQSPRIERKLVIIHTPDYDGCNDPTLIDVPAAWDMEAMRDRFAVDVVGCQPGVNDHNKFRAYAESRGFPSFETEKAYIAWLVGQGARLVPTEEAYGFN